MLAQLQQTCRDLLEQGTVKVIIGSGSAGAGDPPHPVFITKPEDVAQLVWNDQCYANLTVYLTRKDIRALGKPAIIVKGCDARALVVLEKESQIERANLVALGMACTGVGQPPAAKCATCEVRVPAHVDQVIGTAEQPAVDPAQRYADVAAFLQKTPAERLEYWKAELARCIKCYACRAVCPFCYCERCVADKNRPQCIDSSSTLKGNFAWQITRSFHQAARCIGCDECTRVCPAGINLRLLNQALARAAEAQFGYRAGMDAKAEPVVGSYSPKDKEEFIG